MKLTAEMRRKAPRRLFAMPLLKKYYLGDCRHVGSAVKRFRENKRRYPKQLRTQAANVITESWLKCHAPDLSPRERKSLVPRVRKALRL